MAKGTPRLSPSQRRFIIASLLLLALASAAYCLDYRSKDFYRLNGRLYTAVYNHLSETPPPVITFGDQSTPSSEPTIGPFRVSVSGLFPRSGMTYGGAVIGGLLLPCILILAACFLALGRVRATDAGDEVIGRRGP